MGKCSACNEWNTVKPFKVPKSVSGIGSRMTKNSVSSTISGSKWIASENGGEESMVHMDAVIVEPERSRIKTFSEELNRVVGGGLVKGSVVLLAGEPGIGKSTLLIQLASNIGLGTVEYNSTSSERTVAYISGEENADQIVSRARRLGLGLQQLYLLCETDTERVIDEICAMTTKPALVIVDSIQTMRTEECSSGSGVGSVTQIRECTAKYVQLAKSTGIVVMLVGHVTKSGEAAGPKVLEHMVDAVLYMEGSDRADYRLVRGTKNR